MQNKPRLDQANLGLLFNKSKLLLNDNLDLILECEKVKDILFYSIDFLNLLNINKKILSDNNVNAQIDEINSKINLLINQMNNKDEDSGIGFENNIHDIILFVLFGVFVILILESLYKLTFKILKKKYFNNITNNK